MKKTYTITILMLILSYVSTSAQSTIFDDIGQKSPKASVEQKIGLTDVAVAYYRPATRERKIWGEVVPYGEVWRAGANFATSISLSTDVKVNGKDLKAGKYSLFVLPEKSQWVFIFDASPVQFGTFFYTGKTDVLRVSAVPQKSRHQEDLTYSFGDLGFNRATLSLSWGKLSTSLEIETSREAILSRIRDLARQAIEEKNSSNLTSLVAWAIDHRTLVDEARTWLTEAHKIGPDFGNQFLAARMLAHDKQWDEAIAKAEQVSEEFPRFKSIPPTFIRRWKKGIE